MFKNPGFTSMENVPESCIAGVGDPLLRCAEVLKDTAEEKYDLTGTSVPF